jgi:hypothetical protein
MDPGMTELRRDCFRAIATAVAASLLTALAACGTTKPMYAADGRPSVLITCKGYLSSWSACLVKAGRACASRGYDTLHSDEYDRTLIIACKRAAAT